MKLHKNCLVVLIAVIFVLQLGCNDTVTGFRYEKEHVWNGQVVYDFVYAILKPDHTVWTWGPNYLGTLGNGTTNKSDFPVKTLKISNIITLDLSFGAAFAADKDGNIWFWGNYWIWLGPPNVDTNVTVPIKIAFLRDVTAISVWGAEVHLLTKDGSVWYMIMDTESPKVAVAPTQYARVNNVISLDKFYALRTDGKIYRLGIGDFLPNVPQGVTMMQTTQKRTVLLKSDGTVWAWGKNDLGQLGNGTFVDSDVPVQIKNLHNIIAISSNYDYNLALMKDGSVWYWGYAGKQGDSLMGINLPVKVEGLLDVTLIYASANSIVMKEDGTYWSFTYVDRIPKQVRFH
jgi:alpha-tubulin suppressor-like RCC1 family protein